MLLERRRSRWALLLLALTLSASAPARDFDVRSFGATGDGTTIDSDAINRELHGLRAQKSGGAPTLVLRDVDELRVDHSPPLRDTYVKHAARMTY